MYVGCGAGIKGALVERVVYVRGWGEVGCWGWIVRFERGGRERSLSMELAGATRC